MTRRSIHSTTKKLEEKVSERRALRQEGTHLGLNRHGESTEGTDNDDGREDAQGLTWWCLDCDISRTRRFIENAYVDAEHDSEQQY